MNEIRHTPGPWEIEKAGGPGGDHTIRSVEHSTWIAQVIGEDIPDAASLSNANLIAASPELLDAAIAVVIAHESNDGQMDDTFSNDMVNRLRDAILKATREPRP